MQFVIVAVSVGTEWRRPTTTTKSIHTNKRLTEQQKGDNHAEWQNMKLKMA